MKFRALVTDSSTMKDIMNIATSLSRFSKECVMRIATKKVTFIVSDEDSGPRRPLAWVELPTSFYFKEYDVVGVSQEHNEIYLEFSTILLAKSLSLLKQHVKLLKIKLTDKDAPCLTFEMELSSNNVLSHQCVHDIPVQVISHKHWKDYVEPYFNDFNISVEMPNMKTVKTIVEKIKNISPTLIVSAAKDGRLTFQTKTNLVTLSAHFPHLNVKSFASIDQLELENNEEEQHKISSTVDIKKLLMFLSGLQMINCQKTICSIVHNEMVKLMMEQPGALVVQVFLSQLTI